MYVHESAKKKQRTRVQKSSMACDKSQWHCTDSLPTSHLAGSQDRRTFATLCHRTPTKYGLEPHTTATKKLRHNASPMQIRAPIEPERHPLIQGGEPHIDYWSTKKQCSVYKLKSHILRDSVTCFIKHLECHNNAIVNSRLLVLSYTFWYPHQVSGLLLPQSHVSKKHCIMKLHTYQGKVVILKARYLGHMLLSVSITQLSEISSARRTFWTKWNWNFPTAQANWRKHSHTNNREGSSHGIPAVEKLVLVSWPPLHRKTCPASDFLQKTTWQILLDMVGTSP